MCTSTCARLSGCTLRWYLAKSLLHHSSPAFCTCIRLGIYLRRRQRSDCPIWNLLKRLITPLERFCIKRFFLIKNMLPSHPHAYVHTCIFKSTITHNKLIPHMHMCMTSKYLLTRRTHCIICDCVQVDIVWTPLVSPDDEDMEVNAQTHPPSHPHRPYLRQRTHATAPPSLAQHTSFTHWNIADHIASAPGNGVCRRPQTSAWQRNDIPR